MDCQQCGQEKARVQYTEVVGAQKQVQWLCGTCAQAEGLLDVASTSPEPAASGLRMRCETCRTTLANLRRSGRVGCPDCYETFQEHLNPLLQRVHGCLHHGESSSEMDPEDAGHELRRLEADLARAVADEDFEAAARLRDEIDRAQPPGEAES